MNKYTQYVSTKKTKHGIEYSFNDIANSNAIGADYKLADFTFVMSQLSASLGDILTIIDASFTDPVQRKAIKDLIRKSFSDRIDTAVSMLQIACKEPELTDEEFNSIEEVTVDEVLGLEKPKE